MLTNSGGRRPAEGLASDADTLARMFALAEDAQRYNQARSVKPCVACSRQRGGARSVEQPTAKPV